MVLQRSFFSLATAVRLVAIEQFYVNCCLLPIVWPRCVERSHKNRATQQSSARILSGSWGWKCTRRKSFGGSCRCWRSQRCRRPSRHRRMEASFSLIIAQPAMPRRAAECRRRKCWRNGRPRKFSSASLPGSCSPNGAIFRKPMSEPSPPR